MHYFLYPIRDAFITNQPNLMLKNTGLDEIVEVEKTMQPKSCAGGPGAVVSRGLLHFDLSDVSASMSTGSILSPKFVLRLKVSDVLEVPVEYSVVAFPVSKPWAMGTGYKFDGNLVPDGVNWKYTDGGTTKWFATQSLTDCFGGGTWFSSTGVESSGSTNFPSGSLMASQSFNYQTSDVAMDITHIVSEWLNGSVSNNGIILMQADELSLTNYGKLRFFAKESNTIYQPYLDVMWDDSVFETGSLEGTGSLNPVDINSAVVSLPRLRKSYQENELVRVDVIGRKMYPQKTFTNRLSDYLEPEYLPFDSFYSIRDAETERTIIPADEFTRLSCDGRGNYFILDTTGLPQERYYRVDILSEQNGTIVTFQSPLSFKISR